MATSERTAKQVIDQAIQENRSGERLLYFFAFVFVACGATTLMVGVFRNQGLIAVVGCVASGLFFPAMREAKQIRQENLAIRLLERPLSMAGSAEAAARALQEFFENTFRRSKSPERQPDQV